MRKNNSPYILGSERPRSGIVLTPFRWAAEPLLALIEKEPFCFELLCKIGRTRMHTIAFALAHSEEDFLPASWLLRGSIKEIVKQTAGRQLSGIARAFAHLPDFVLSQPCYGHLVNLLEDRPIARLLHHREGIDETAITVLYGVPPPLRPAVMKAFPQTLDRLDGLSDGLRDLVTRGVAQNYDSIVMSLCEHKQPQQLTAAIRALVDALPLPASLPPARIGKATRIDSVTDLHALAGRWSNCLAGYAPLVNEGICAVYLWEHDVDPALCLVQRHGRFGWFVDDIKGPRNAAVATRQRQDIQNAFDQATIPAASIIGALEYIYDGNPILSCRQGVQVRGQQLEYPWAFELDR